MQSSPPARAWDHPSSPTNESQWSLDLGALDPHSGTSTPLPKPHVDRIFSEDIDGPSDFTENMEAWMRGGSTRKMPAKGTLRGTLRGAKPSVQTVFEQREDSVKDEHHQHSEGAGEAGKEDEVLEEERSASHHTPEHSPQRERGSTRGHASEEDRSGQKHGEEQVSSDWDPYQQDGSTPQPPAHKQFLQPTVEDYYSELVTPARQPTTQNPRSPPQDPASTPHAEAEVEESFVSERETEGRASSPTLSPIRSPVTQRQSRRDTPPTEDLNLPDLAQHLHELRAKCQQLEHLNNALSDALEQERQQRQDDEVRHEQAIAESARRERDLNVMKEEAYRDKDAFRKEFADLQGKAHTYETSSNDQAERHRRDIDDLRRASETEIRRFEERSEAERTEHEQELRALEKDLDLARRSRDGAEEAARTHQEEAKRLRESHQADMTVKEAQRQRTNTACETLAQQVKAAERERDVARADAYEKDQATQDLRVELENTQQNRDNETKQLESEHTRALQLAEKQQDQLKELKQRIEDQRAAHDAALKQQATESLQNLQTNDAETENLRNELEAAQSQLNSALIDRDEAQDSLQSLQELLSAAQQEATQRNTELNQAREQLDELRADNAEVNAALDARISDAMRRRESYWRGRLAEAEKERQLMGKALLKQWGREEVGPMEPEQAYEYKFVSKGSPAKAGA